MSYSRTTIHPKSDYVKSYKDALKILLVERTERSPAMFSIEDCEKIRKRLPSAHTIVNKREYGDFLYDHLFVKYFVNNKKYNYDPAYIAYGTDMFLYLQLYKSIKRGQPKAKSLPLPNSLGNYGNSLLSSSFDINHQTTIALLKGNISLSFKKGELSMCKMMEKLCKDIKEVLYMHLTIENNANVEKNMKALQYIYNIYKVAGFNKNNMDDLTINSSDQEILNIHRIIVEHLNQNDILDFFIILLEIYEKIMVLYKLYKYKIPYSFLEIYNGSASCYKDSDPITLDNFDESYIEDDGTVSILPYYKEGREDNINAYHCFFTEGIYKMLDLPEPRNPKTREPLTQKEIDYIRDNMIKVIDKIILGKGQKEIQSLQTLKNNIVRLRSQTPGSALKFKIDPRFKNIFVFFNNSEEMDSISTKPINVKIIGSYSLQLGIKLGSILFKLISVDNSLIDIQIPIFNSKLYNNEILKKLKQLERLNDTGFFPSQYGTLMMKQHVFINTNNSNITESIYTQYKKSLDNLNKQIKSATQNGRIG